MAVRVRQERGSWVVYAEHGPERRRKKTIGPKASDRKLAEALAAEWKAKITLGHVDEVFVPKAATPGAPSTYPLLKDALPEFIDRREKLERLRGASTETYRAVVRTWLIPAFGTRPVDTITRREIGALVEKVKLAGRSAAVVQRVCHILKTYFTDLVERELLATNPAADLVYFKGKLPKRKPIVIFSKEECRTLLAASEGTREWAFVHMALGTGARWGELAALTRDDVDLDHDRDDQGRVVGRVHVTKSWSPKVSKVLPTKAGNIRFIPLSPELVGVLRQWIETRSAEGWGEGALMFPYKSGGHLMHYQAPWKALLKRARLARRPFKSLRHSFASHLLRAGVRPELVQQWMGHATLTETLNTYRSFIPDHASDQGDVGKLGRLLD